MAKYRKKPVEVEAIKTAPGTKSSEVFEFTDGQSYLKDGQMYIKTLEGDMHAAIGDYIIKGVQDEFYPCKPDIFHATYEAVE